MKSFFKSTVVLALSLVPAFSTLPVLAGIYDKKVSITTAPYSPFNDNSIVPKKSELSNESVLTAIYNYNTNAGLRHSALPACPVSNLYAFAACINITAPYLTKEEIARLAVAVSRQNKDVLDEVLLMSQPAELQSEYAKFLENIGSSYQYVAERELSPMEILYYYADSVKPEDRKFNLPPLTNPKRGSLSSGEVKSLLLAVREDIKPDSMELRDIVGYMNDAGLVSDSSGDKTPLSKEKFLRDIKVNNMFISKIRTASPPYDKPKSLDLFIAYLNSRVGSEANVDFRNYYIMGDASSPDDQHTAYKALMNRMVAYGLQAGAIDPADKKKATKDAVDGKVDECVGGTLSAGTSRKKPATVSVPAKTPAGAEDSPKTPNVVATPSADSSNAAESAGSSAPRNAAEAERLARMKSTTKEKAGAGAEAGGDSGGGVFGGSGGGGGGGSLGGGAMSGGSGGGGGDASGGGGSSGGSGDSSGGALSGDAMNGLADFMKGEQKADGDLTAGGSSLFGGSDNPNGGDPFGSSADSAFDWDSLFSSVAPDSEEAKDFAFADKGGEINFDELFGSGGFSFDDASEGGFGESSGFDFSGGGDFGGGDFGGGGGGGDFGGGDFNFGDLGGGFGDSTADAAVAQNDGTAAADDFLAMFEKEDFGDSSASSDLSASLPDGEMGSVWNDSDLAGSSGGDVDFSAALSDAQVKLIANPANVDAYLERAGGSFAVKRYPDVVRDCQTVLKLSPGNVKALVLLAQAYAGMGEFEKARTAINSALSDEPKNENLLVLHSLIAEKLGKYSEMLADLKQLTELNKEKFNPRFQKAIALYGAQAPEFLASADGSYTAAKAGSSLFARVSPVIKLIVAAILLGGVALLVAFALPKVPLRRPVQLAAASFGMPGCAVLENVPAGTLTFPDEEIETFSVGGQYTVTSLVYEGYDGTLYRGVNKTELPVMIREISGLPAENLPKAEELFGKFKGVRHINLVEMFNVLSENGKLYIVSENVDAALLPDELEGGRVLALAEAMPVFRNVCAAMDYLHHRNLSNGGLIPADIMLDGSDGFCRVANMGLGTVILRNNGSSKHYIAPEGVKHGFTVQFDIYALGAVFYRTVTGVPPEAGKIKAPSEIKSDIPKAVDAVLAQALNADPEERFDSVDEFLAVLETAVKIPEPPVVVEEAAVVQTPESVKQEEARNFGKRSESSDILFEGMRKEETPVKPVCKEDTPSAPIALSDNSDPGKPQLKIKTIKIGKLPDTDTGQTNGKTV